MFIELAGGETERRRSGMCHMSLLRSSVRYRATHSINIPRLWRSGIREFANSIKPAVPHFDLNDYSRVIPVV